MFLLPFDGSSQAVLSPADRIRIKQVDGTILTGTLATFSAETIQLGERDDLSYDVEITWPWMGDGAMVDLGLTCHPTRS